MEILPENLDNFLYQTQSLLQFRPEIENLLINNSKDRNFFVNLDF